jgi:ABC-type polysaccharide/polyol phosphate transport system ATPase subunit
MPLIIAKNINKEFKIGRQGEGCLSVINNWLFNRQVREKIKVIDDLSFSLNAGEFVCLVGKNGAGKTSLLRLLAGIYEFDKGELKISDRSLAVVGPDLGLKTRLTMKDNIFLLGAFWGLSRQNIKRKMDSIVTRSGLEDYLHTKIFQFSRGMLERLVFSVLVHADGEIILLDEFFEAVDDDFRQSAEQELVKITRNGKLSILATHDMEIARRLADKVMLLDNGKIIDFGEPGKVLNVYKSL